MKNQENIMSQTETNNSLEAMPNNLISSPQNAVSFVDSIMTQNAETRNSRGSFDIRDYVDKLTPAKERNKFICPVCGGNDLAIGPETGAYRCFSTGCEPKDIRDAIAPLTPKARREYRARKSRPKTVKEKDKEAQLESAMVEAKVQELFRMVESGSFTPAQANVDLGAWCRQHGHDKYSASRLLQESLKVLKDAKGDDDEKPRLLKEYELIKSTFGDRLRFNTLFKQIELDGQEFPVEMAKIEFLVEHGLKLKSNRQDLADATVKIAKLNTYNPIVEYLDRVAYQYGPSTDILEGIAERYFGTSLPIHQVTLVKFLIGAVARAYHPGCKLDTALILQGAQGTGKSSFFRVLASEPWFDDSFGNSSDKDERLKLHQAWVIEWAELETLFKRKDIAQVKAFMTTQYDKLRPPYGRVTETMKRGSIFVGTTNQSDFLTDSTGNRRFWVISTQQAIDIERLSQERDRIWAAAVSFYRQGVSWWLNKEEEAAMVEERAVYESHDIWQDEIATFIASLERVAIWEILEILFKIEKGQQDKRHQHRVRDCLTNLGWVPVPKTVWHLGKASKVWIKK